MRKILFKLYEIDSDMFINTAEKSSRRSCQLYKLLQLAVIWID
jgi:hypothetical protein